jgi:hypothetical protein
LRRRASLRACDASKNGRDLDLVGGVGFDPTGLFGQVLSLSGNPLQSATRPVDGAVFKLGVNDFSLQVWVNFNNLAERGSKGGRIFG